MSFGEERKLQLPRQVSIHLDLRLTGNTAYQRQDMKTCLGIIKNLHINNQSLRGKLFFSLFLKCFPLAILVNISSLIIAAFGNRFIKKGKHFILSRLGTVCCKPVSWFSPALCNVPTKLLPLLNHTGERK